MIKVNNISHSFDGAQVLNELTLSFDGNGIYVLMGQSGCGKTTLLNIIAGLIKPDQGTIESTCKNVSYMFQEPRLLPWSTAIDNVNLVLGGGKQTLDAARGALERLGLGEHTGKYPDELSGGMKQRVSLARALAYGADLLLLDEPFNGLDDEMCRTIIDILKEYSKDALVIVVSHYAEYSAMLCDDSHIIKLDKMQNINN